MPQIGHTHRDTMPRVELGRIDASSTSKSQTLSLRTSWTSGQGPRAYSDMV